jgi:hypothetical protein
MLVKYCLYAGADSEGDKYFRNSKLKADKRKWGKKFTTERFVECFHPFNHIENPLLHWSTFAYIFDSKTVEEETAVCIIH